MRGILDWRTKSCAQREVRAQIVREKRDSYLKSARVISQRLKENLSTNITKRELQSETKCYRGGRMMDYEQTHPSPLVQNG